MKRDEFNKTVEGLKEIYFKDGQCYDIAYVCSDELYNDELGFKFITNIPGLDYKLAIEYEDEYNLYVIVNSADECKEINEFRLIPREPKPITIKFE